MNAFSLNFCNNTSTSDYIEDLYEENTSWDYYTKDRAVFNGIPFAIITCLACACLFKCATPATAATFAVVNYITLTSLLEIIRANHFITNTKATVIIAVSAAASYAFIQNICQWPINYQATLILTAAAFAGQLAREFMMKDDS